MQAADWTSAQTGSQADPVVLRTIVIAGADLWVALSAHRAFRPRAGFVLIRGQESLDLLAEQCERMSPCVLLICDQLFGTASGPAVLRRMHGTGVRALLYGSSPDDSQQLELLECGCFGFLERGASIAAIKKAVLAVFAGEMWVRRRVLTSAFQEIISRPERTRLTPRERDILQLVGRGLSNRMIAEELSISYETVRWHVRALHSKLKVADRTATESYARRLIEEQRGRPSSSSAFLVKRGAASQH